jgi:CspA family cold shock protein
VITHTVERKRNRLRVVLELDLGEVQAHLPLPTAPNEDVLYRRLMNYLLTRVGADVFDVARILQEQGETGTVKWFSESKGYGFIRTSDKQDVFVHHRGIRGDGIKSLIQGQVVRFKRREGRETYEAIDVEPV